MRLHSRQQIGQSGNELVLTVFFSFFLHAALVVFALVFYTVVAPKAHVPPFYEVKLVGQPAETKPAPAPEPPPPAPKEEPAPPEVKPRPKAKKAATKPEKKALKKDAVPELSRRKPKPAPKEEARPQPPEKAAAPPAPPVTPAAKTEAVAVKTSSEGFKFTPYLAIIRDKIERNWMPPEGPRGMRVTIRFTVHRSGKVVETSIENSTANFYFEQAAVRAILLSSPFPHMPDGFYRESAVFSVDLVKQE
jgi:protein TonB